ncbi:hypothetical protein CSC70_12765, partial [Pseudoxanthomonas kalamensis DSM 18571]
GGGVGLRQHARRRPELWGRPPGMLAQTDTPTDAGRAQGSARSEGYGQDIHAAEPSMQVGGYQIVYDLRNENRLRGWRDEGMTEISFPLPGMRQFMVCPLEIALRRGSGGCRLAEPNDPELDSIGDARKVVTVVRVYHRGDLVWRGPGAYR